MFLMHGWKAALLSTSLILLSLALRFVADAVYRIGQDLSENVKSDSADKDSTLTFQRWLYVFTLALVYATCAGIVVQTYFLADEVWISSLLVSLIGVELAFIWIRQVNKQISFRQASYGLQDQAPFGLRASRRSELDTEKAERLDRKIAELESLAEEGKISQRAFEKARDRHRIKDVMDRDD